MSQRGGRRGSYGPGMPAGQGGGRGGRGGTPQPDLNMVGRGRGVQQQGAWGRGGQQQGGRGGQQHQQDRVPNPDLHQAIAAPRQGHSTLAPQPTEVSLTQQKFQNLTVGESSTSVSPPSAPELSISPAAPASSKAMSFPRRPGKGTLGQRCLVKANHFFVELPKAELYHYDVTIAPEVTSRGLNRAVISELVRLYKMSALGGRLPAYDGRKNLYTAGSLPFESRNFDITLPDMDNVPGQSRGRLFKVAIKFAARAELQHLEAFLHGRVAEAPQETLQILDVVLRELPTQRFCPVGRSFYSREFSHQTLGNGLESWSGFYQSIRPTQMGLSLNINMSTTAFFKPEPIIDFVKELLDRCSLSPPFKPFENEKMKKALRGIKVEVTHRGNIRRKYRISGLTSQPTRDISFDVDDTGVKKTIVQYFAETYGIRIEHTALPCLIVGNLKKPTYLPMEVCKIVDGQRYSKRLNAKQITNLLRASCQRPQDKENEILNTVRRNSYSNDQYAREFDIRIDERLTTVEARVLDPPKLQYRNSVVVPQTGQWNMINKKMVNGGTVDSWFCLNFCCDLSIGVAEQFCDDLLRECNNSGMVVNRYPAVPLSCYRGPNRPSNRFERLDVEKFLHSQFEAAMENLPHGKLLDLIIFILPDDNGTLYGDLKMICETDLGVVSQCCLLKSVCRPNPQLLANLALKINVKVGGRNMVLVDALSRRINLVTDKPTIIFGADVTHPHAGEDSTPSIAAVVASQDWPEITKYSALVSGQSHREELIQDLYTGPLNSSGTPTHAGMIRDLLLSFHKATKQIPQRIIFYRDGVSEGQFHQVLLHEVTAIRKACSSIQAGYRPSVTFVIVQKRHHTRLFANNHGDRRSVDRSGNVMPGTVVDTKICHPTEFDFYLCSHAGIKGTSRPTHYHVIWDENNFTADQMQKLTNDLCYTYQRCTRSVSIVPPAYYAHLAAYRARFYMQAGGSGSGSDTESATRGAAGTGGSVPVQVLPSLHERMKPVMFYC